MSDAVEEKKGLVQECKDLVEAIRTIDEEAEVSSIFSSLQKFPISHVQHKLVPPNTIQCSSMNQIETYSKTCQINKFFRFCQ